MKLHRSTRSSISSISVAPLINVVLLLLLFFLLGSSLLPQPGIAVALPRSHFEVLPSPDCEIVSIRPGPPPQIYLRDQFMPVEALGAWLAAHPGNNRSLVIRADRGTPYELVMEIATRGLAQRFNVVLATSPEAPARP